MKYINRKDKKFCDYHLHLKCDELRSHRMELNSEFITTRKIKVWSNISCGSFALDKDVVVTISDDGKIAKQIKCSKEKKKIARLQENNKKDNPNILQSSKRDEIQNMINHSRSSSRCSKFLTSLLNYDPSKPSSTTGGGL